MPPLSRCLRDSATALQRSLAPSAKRFPVSFQRFTPSPVRLPERFRGGCAFGGGTKPHSPGDGLTMPFS